MKKIITTDQAPAPIGPYSQAILANGFLFCSGQIAIDPQSGTIVGDSAAQQTRQVILNLQNVLQKAGLTLEHVVKTTIFLKNMDDFSQVNEEYERFFGKSKPARATVEVSRLPKDVLVEISCVAIAE